MVRRFDLNQARPSRLRSAFRAFGASGEAKAPASLAAANPRHHKAKPDFTQSTKAPKVPKPSASPLSIRLRGDLGSDYVSSFLRQESKVGRCPSAAAASLVLWCFG